MDKRVRDTIRKAAILLTAAFMVGSIVYITSDVTQSRFRAFDAGGAVVFVDKYVPGDLRSEFLAERDEAIRGFLSEAGFAAADILDEPTAYFAADRHYGVVSANDPLVARKLRGRPSSDFVMFRTISQNFYANELVSSSVTSQDGQYVFINLDEGWRTSILHAYVHALAARHMPDAVRRSAFGNDASFDPELRFGFRFVDEVVALMASDLSALAGPDGSVEAAWMDFTRATSEKYGRPESSIRELEDEIIYMTFDLPQKTSEFYAACNGFAAFILARHGSETLATIASTFLSGEYATMDDVFAPIGGLAAALGAWKGDPGIPR